ncbi:hypothetical protein UXP46_23080 [Enterobacter ludwigii]|uniref:transposase n=1 Tax=Enterobacter ludwigii TaxID=299767 RepID=UPI002FD3478B
MSKRSSSYKFRAGSFSEDSRGRWYFNIYVEVETQPTTGTTAVGVDLGLKDTATASDGQKLPAGRFYRDLQSALGKAQRAGKKARVRAIHAKIKNRRKEHSRVRTLPSGCRNPRPLGRGGCQ